MADTEMWMGCRISGFTTNLLSFVLPLCILIAASCVNRSAFELHHSALGLWTSRWLIHFWEASYLTLNVFGQFVVSFGHRGCQESCRWEERSILEHRFMYWLFLGRLRPDFLARCKWGKAIKQCTGWTALQLGKSILSLIFFLTQKDGWRIGWEEVVSVRTLVDCFRRDDFHVSMAFCKNCGVVFCCAFATTQSLDCHVKIWQSSPDNPTFSFRNLGCYF